MRKLPFQIFEDFFSDIAYYFDLAMSATSSQPGGGALPFNEQGRTKNGDVVESKMEAEVSLGHPSLALSVSSLVRVIIGWGHFPRG